MSPRARQMEIWRLEENQIRSYRKHSMALWRQLNDFTSHANGNTQNGNSWVESKQVKAQQAIKWNSRKNGAIIINKRETTEMHICIYIYVYTLFNCCMSCRDCSNNNCRNYRNARQQQHAKFGSALNGPNIFVLNAINCDIIFLCNRKRNHSMHYKERKSATQNVSVIEVPWVVNWWATGAGVGRSP